MPNTLQEVKLMSIVTSAKPDGKHAVHKDLVSQGYLYWRDGWTGATM